MDPNAYRRTALALQKRFLAPVKGEKPYPDLHNALDVVEDETTGGTVRRKCRCTSCKYKRDRIHDHSGLLQHIQRLHFEDDLELAEMAALEEEERKTVGALGIHIIRPDPAELKGKKKRQSLGGALDAYNANSPTRSRSGRSPPLARDALSTESMGRSKAASPPKANAKKKGKDKDKDKGRPNSAVVVSTTVTKKPGKKKRGSSDRPESAPAATKGPVLFKPPRRHAHVESRIKRDMEEREERRADEQAARDRAFAEACAVQTGTGAVPVRQHLHRLEEGEWYAGGRYTSHSALRLAAKFTADVWDFPSPRLHRGDGTDPGAQGPLWTGDALASAASEGNLRLRELEAWGEPGDNARNGGWLGSPPRPGSAMKRPASARPASAVPGRRAGAGAGEGSSLPPRPTSVPPHADGSSSTAGSLYAPGISRAVRPRSRDASVVGSLHASSSESSVPSVAENQARFRALHIIPSGARGAAGGAAAGREPGPADTMRRTLQHPTSSYGRPPSAGYGEYLPSGDGASTAQAVGLSLPRTEADYFSLSRLSYPPPGAAAAGGGGVRVVIPTAAAPRPLELTESDVGGPVGGPQPARRQRPSTANPGARPKSAARKRGGAGARQRPASAAPVLSSPERSPDASPARRRDAAAGEGGGGDVSYLYASLSEDHIRALADLRAESDALALAAEASEAAASEAAAGAGGRSRDATPPRGAWVVDEPSSPGLGGAAERGEGGSAGGGGDRRRSRARDDVDSARARAHMLDRHYYASPEIVPLKEQLEQERREKEAEAARRVEAARRAEERRAAEAEEARRAEEERRAAEEEEAAARAAAAEARRAAAIAEAAAAAECDAAVRIQSVQRGRKARREVAEICAAAPQMPGSMHVRFADPEKAPSPGKEGTPPPEPPPLAPVEEVSMVSLVSPVPSPAPAAGKAEEVGAAAAAAAAAPELAHEEEEEEEEEAEAAPGVGRDQAATAPDVAAPTPTPVPADAAAPALPGSHSSTGSAGRPTARPGGSGTRAASPARPAAAEAAAGGSSPARPPVPGGSSSGAGAAGARARAPGSGGGGVGGSVSSTSGRPPRPEPSSAASPSSGGAGVGLVAEEAARAPGSHSPARGGGGAAAAAGRGSAPGSGSSSTGRPPRPHPAHASSSSAGSGSGHEEPAPLRTASSGSLSGVFRGTAGRKGVVKEEEDSYEPEVRVSPAGTAPQWGGEEEEEVVRVPQPAAPECGDGVGGEGDAEDEDADGNQAATAARKEAQAKRQAKLGLAPAGAQEARMQKQRMRALSARRSSSSAASTPTGDLASASSSAAPGDLAPPERSASPVHGAGSRGRGLEALSTSISTDAPVVSPKMSRPRRRRSDLSVQIPRDGSVGAAAGSASTTQSLDAGLSPNNNGHRLGTSSLRGSASNLSALDSSFGSDQGGVGRDAVAMAARRAAGLDTSVGSDGGLGIALAASAHRRSGSADLAGAGGPESPATPADRRSPEKRRVLDDALLGIDRSISINRSASRSSMFLEGSSLVSPTMGGGGGGAGGPAGGGARPGTAGAGGRPPAAPPAPPGVKPPPPAGPPSAAFPGPAKIVVA